MRSTPKRTGMDARGLHVVGPGFYLWDADPREALRLAADLRRHAPQPQPNARRRPPPPRAPLG